jgi:hypothetical protein
MGSERRDRTISKLKSDLKNRVEKIYPEHDREATNVNATMR